MSFAIHYLSPVAFDERISISCAGCFVQALSLAPLLLLLVLVLKSAVVENAVAGRLRRLTPPTRLVLARVSLLSPPRRSFLVAARNCLFHLLLVLMLTLRYNDGPFTDLMEFDRFNPAGFIV